MLILCRYMLGDDEKSLYVAFMGTKHMRDLLSDANFLQEAVWKAKDPGKQQQVRSTPRWPTSNQILDCDHDRVSAVPNSVQSCIYVSHEILTTDPENRVLLTDNWPRVLCCSCKYGYALHGAPLSALLLPQASYKLFLFRVGRSSCTQRLSCQSPPHPSGSVVCPCYKPGQNLGALWFVTHIC